MGAFETVLILLIITIGLLFLVTMGLFVFYSSYKTLILEMKHDFEKGREIVNKRHKK